MFEIEGDSLRLRVGRTVWAGVNVNGEKRRVLARIVEVREEDCFVHPLRGAYQNEVAEVQDQWVTKNDLERI